MKTILATVYAVNPFKGSEDGMGWNFIYQIARHQKVIAITRKNNKEHIEKYMMQHPDKVYRNIQYLYFDLPKWAIFWKRKHRGALIYFYLWQRFLPMFVRKQNLSFDVVHNVNFHNDWTPSFLWKLNKPFVWGPIGHHTSIPHDFLKNYALSYYLKDRLTTFVKKLFWHTSFSLKKTVQQSNHIFCMNSSIPQVLNLKDKKHSFMPSVATQDFGFQLTQQEEHFIFLSIGRLVPLKGFDLTINSFAKFIKMQPQYIKDKCRLILIGSGPEYQTYKELIEELEIQEYATIIEWMSRDKLIEWYKKASVFVFPSHEGAGMVVAEALSFGLPVLCLDNYGPGEFIDQESGFSIPYTNYKQTIIDMSMTMNKLFHSPELLTQMRIKARAQFEKNFQWNSKGDELKKVYLTL